MICFPINGKEIVMLNKYFLRHKTVDRIRACWIGAIVVLNLLQFGRVATYSRRRSQVVNGRATIIESRLAIRSHSIEAPVDEDIVGDDKRLRLGV